MKTKQRKESVTSAGVSVSEVPSSVFGQSVVSEAETSLNNNDEYVVPVDVGGSTSQQMATSATRTRCRCVCQFGSSHRKAAVGTGLAVLGAVSWVGATICAKRLYRWPDFYAPYFVVYFSTSWLSVIYPVYAALTMMVTNGAVPLKETTRDSLRVFREEGLGASPYKAFGKCFGFCLLWNLTCYVYLRGLSFKGPLDTVALFATNSNFVYLMSWIILQKKFIAARIVAFIIAMTGIIVITYMESSFANQGMWGSVLTMIATACAAGYKVLFRRVLGDITFDQVACFLTGLGLCNMLTMWPLFLVLYFTKAEPIHWDKVPWDMVVGASAFSLFLNFLFQFGTVVTYNLMLQVSFILAIPLCAVALIILDGLENLYVEGIQIGAYVLIFVGFLINVLPEDWYTSALKAIRCKRTDVTRNHVESRMTPRQRIRSVSELHHSVC